MTYSLNEIEGLCKKAARGSGCSWGMAEEAAKAVRWLVSFDFAGPSSFADLLALHDKKPRVEFTPATCADVWRGKGGRLCPIASGAALCDYAGLIAWESGVEMAEVAHPLLLLPFTATTARTLGQSILVSWGHVHVHVEANNVWIADPNNEIGIAAADRVSLRLEQSPEGTPLAPTHRGTISPDVWAKLNGFAHRTYAPATEESRNLGAGAGVSDND